MEKINLIEILKDCPRGMELDCSLHTRPVIFNCVKMGSDYPIRISSKDGFNHSLTYWGSIYNREDAKCIIFPKGKTTWEGFQRPFKDGDIISDKRFNSVCIFKGEGHIKGTVDFYCGISGISKTCGGDGFIIKDIKNQNWHFGDIDEYNFATEEEKQKLFQAINDNGYKWNEKTKALEKLIKPTFKNGDILYVDANDRRSDDDCYKYVFIFEELVGRDKEEIYGRKVMAHCYMTVNGYFKPKNVYLIDDNIYPIRFATEEEKQKLFQIIKDNDYKWDEKTKTLEKSIKPKFKVGDKIVNDDYVVEIIDMDIEGEVYGYKSKAGATGGILFIEQDEWELVLNKFDFTTLKPYDKVLTRCSSLEKWRIQLFEKYDKTCKFPFICMGYNKYNQCVPYEGNEHLLDTADSCSDYYLI